MTNYGGISRIKSKRIVDWDKTDPATGLSVGCKVACDIIDGLNHHELRLFNAPRRDNPAITAGELVERYMAVKSQKGEIHHVKFEADGEESDPLEDEEGEASAFGVDEGSTTGKADEVQEPINEVTQTRRKSLNAHTKAEDVREKFREFGRKGKLRGIKDREDH